MSVEILDVELTSDEFEDTEKMASLKHGNIGSRLNRYLGAYAEDNNLGLVFDAQTTFKLLGTPPTHQPDVAFVAYAKLPDDLQALLEIAPDLAVEVISENEKAYDIEKKVFQYQQSAFGWFG